MRRRMTPLVLLLATVLPACASSAPGGDAAAPEVELRLQLAADLQPFADCDELVSFLHDHAIEQLREAPIASAVEPDIARREVSSGVSAVQTDALAAEGGASDSGVASGGPSSAGLLDGFSQTNVQEQGVDEPDVAKTDGSLLVTVARGQLQVVDVSTGARRLSSLPLPEGGGELFLNGTRAVVVSPSWGDVVPLSDGPASASMIAPIGTGTTVVSAIDLSVPSSPRIVDRATFEGDYVSARMRNGIVRLVLRSQPHLDPVPPRAGNPTELQYHAAQIRAVEDSALEDWMPRRLPASDDPSVTPSEHGATPLVGCDDVSRPAEPSGTAMVTVVSIDSAASMEPFDADTVVADAQTVYASPDTLYIATNEWLPMEVPVDDGSVSTTEIHAFDVSSASGTEYLGSGRVRGRLLNQWSLSEHEGYLRVVTTDGSPWLVEADTGPLSESFLTVLALDGDRLVTVGQVGGLGRGERVYSSRFIGDFGYVVTFRETDPLYTLDLSDPTRPRVAGELKIPGFSSYLHPVGDGLLLGVGQDATEDGRTTGSLVSLFDVSDPAIPRRLDFTTVPDGHSAVEYDHRAFLWWARDGLAVMPLEIWSTDVVVDVVPDILEGDGDAPVGVAPAPAQPPFVGAAAFRVAGGDVAEVGRVTHAGRDAPASGESLDPFVGTVPIVRSFVNGNRLLTVSDAGVLASSKTDFTDLAWAAF